MSLPDAVAADIHAFARQLHAQAELYRRVLALGEQQHEALDADNFTLFTSLLGQKTALMQEIAELDAAAAPNRAAFEAHRETVDDAVRARLRAAVEEIRSLLERLIEVEHACEGRLQASKQDVAQELRTLGQGRRALHSYRPAPPPPERRLDLGG